MCSVACRSPFPPLLERHRAAVHVQDASCLGWSPGRCGRCRRGPGLAVWHLYSALDAGEGTGKTAAGNLKSPVVVQAGVLTALLLVDQEWLHDERFWHPLSGTERHRWLLVTSVVSDDSVVEEIVGVHRILSNEFVKTQFSAVALLPQFSL